MDASLHFVGTDYGSIIHIGTDVDVQLRVCSRLTAIFSRVSLLAYWRRVSLCFFFFLLGCEGRPTLSGVLKYEVIRRSNRINV